MSSLHINTDFYARVVSWLERSKPNKGAQDGSEEAKALRSDESSMQGAPTDTEGHIFNDKRKFIALKSIIHFKDSCGAQARKFLDNVLPNSEGREEVQAEYRPRLHVGTFNIKRDLTGLCNGPPLWQDIYIYFTVSSGVNQKLKYNYYYTLEPEANRAKRSFKVEENICDQHNMSRRRRRYNQKKEIEPWVIYKKDFAIHPRFQYLPSMVDLHYKRFKEEYYQQAMFIRPVGSSKSDPASPCGHPGNEERQSNLISPLGLHHRGDGPEVDWMPMVEPPAGFNSVMEGYEQTWGIGMVI